MNRRGDLDDTLQRAIAEFPQDSKPHAISAAIRVNGRLVWTSSESSDHVAAGSAIFPIYSITKTLTAICALRLCEMGELALTDPVHKWLPALDARVSGLTLAHLLRHRSGLGDYGPLPEYHDAVRSNPATPWTPQQFLDTVLAKQHSCPPDDHFIYSNVGYMLIAMMLERATRKSFARIVHEIVIAPLELHDTLVAEEVADWARCIPGFSTQVDARRSLVDIRQVYHPGWCAPRVAVSTAEDITAVYHALFAGRLLQSDSLARMLVLAPISPDHSETIGAGMGLYADRAEAAMQHGPCYGHGGGGPGYELAASALPDTHLGRVTIAVFVSSAPEAARLRETEAALLATLLAREH